MVEARWLMVVEGRRDNKAEEAWRCRGLEPKESDLGSMFEARMLVPLSEFVTMLLLT